MQKRRGSDPFDVVTRETCCWPDCEGRPPESAIPLCGRHVIKVARHAGALIEREKDAARVASHSPDRLGVVYFVRFQGLVKIGFTSDLDQRLANLPHDEVLHSQPGTPADERRVHAAFAHLRVNRREWFRPEPDLLEFVEHLRHAGTVGDLVDA